MNSSKLLSLLENPYKISPEDITDLEQITLEFPFFNLPYIVLAKGYKIKESYKYSSLLPSSALHSKNRNFLYEYIHGQESLAVDSSIKNIEETTDESNKEEIPTIHLTEELRVIDLAKNTEQENLELDTAQEINELAEEKKIQLKKSATPKSSNPQKELVIKPITPIYNIENDFVKEEESLDIQKEFTFSQWLEMGKNPIKTDQKKIDNHSVEESISLIDKFLQEKPRISRPKKEFYKASDFAKRSDTLGDDLVTETLAKILAKQGEYQKAIDIYDKLIVKFPQKRIYFAALKQKIIAKNV